MSWQDPVVTSIFRKTKKHPSGCWEWTGAVAANRAAVCRADGKIKSATKELYSRYFKVDADNLDGKIWRTCRNKLCMNPKHMRVGGEKEIKEMYDKEEPPTESVPVPEKLQLFLDYINEREAVRQRKERGDPPPWTDWDALQRYRFTNVKREYDRTTRAFKAIYDAHRDRPKEEHLLNCGLYRWFGRAEFAEAIGWQYEYDPKYLQSVARGRIDQGLPVFTGAYLITNNALPGNKEDVITEWFLQPFADAIPGLIQTAEETKSWEAVCRELMKVRGFGGSGFMAKEVLQDAILTPALEDVEDRDTWSPAGPGAQKGLNIIFGRPWKKRLPLDQSLREMQFLRDYVNTHKGEHVPNFTVSDCQFNLCEVAKLERTLQGGRAKRRYHKGMPPGKK